MAASNEATLHMNTSNAGLNTHSPATSHPFLVPLLLFYAIFSILRKPNSWGAYISTKQMFETYYISTPFKQTIWSTKQKTITILIHHILEENWVIHKIKIRAEHHEDMMVVKYTIQMHNPHSYLATRLRDEIIGMNSWNRGQLTIKNYFKKR